MNYVRNGRIQRLNSYAAHLILRNGRDLCTATDKRHFTGIDSRTTCRCPRCSLTRSIFRGLKLAAAEEDRQYETLKPVSTTPLVLLKAFAVGTLKSSFPVLFYIVTISLSTALINPTTTRTQAKRESSSDVRMTEEQSHSPTTETQVQPKLYPNAIVTKDQFYSPVTDAQVQMALDSDNVVTEEQILNAIAKPPSQMMRVRPPSGFRVIR